MFFIEKLFNCRNKFSTFCISENNITIFEILNLIGKCLRHTSCKNYYSVRIHSADSVDKFSVFGITYRSHCTTVDYRYICNVFIIRQFISVTQHIFTHSLRFILIDFATECKYIKIHLKIFLFYINS